MHLLMIINLITGSSLEESTAKMRATPQGILIRYNHTLYDH